MRFVGILCLALVLPSVGFAAPPLNDELLAKEYNSCMGGVSDQQDQQRAAYCRCIRDEMKKWDSATVDSVVGAQMQAANSTQIASPKIDALARSCLTQILN